MCSAWSWARTWTWTRCAPTLSAMGRSTLIVGDAQTVKIHVHVPDYMAVFEYVRPLGRIREASTEDMAAQYQEYVAARSHANAERILNASARRNRHHRRRAGRGIGARVPKPGRQRHCPRRADHESQHGTVRAPHRATAHRSHLDLAEQRQRRFGCAPGRRAGPGGQARRRRADQDRATGHRRATGVQLPGQPGGQRRGDGSTRLITSRRAK